MNGAAKVVLVELYNHHEVLNTFNVLLDYLDLSLKVITRKKNLKHIQSIHDNWLVFPDSAPIKKILDTNRALFLQADLVIFTTIQSDFKTFYKISKLTNSVLVVHNAISTFQPWSRLSFINAQEQTFKKFGRFIKYLLHPDSFYRKRMIESLSFFSFPNRIVQEYAESYLKVPQNKILPCIPFTYSEVTYRPDKAESSPVVITIPGTIDPEKKDYGLLLEAFQLIDYFHFSIELIFLGISPKYSQKIIAQFEEIPIPDLRIVSFDEYLPQEKYDEYLKKTDFFVLPFKKDVGFRASLEKLGYTKVSGTINDMIRFGIPALICDHYPLEASLKKLTESFANSRELAQLLTQWVSERRHNTKQENATLKMDQFSLVHSVQQMKKSLKQTGILFY